MLQYLLASVLALVCHGCPLTSIIHHSPPRPVLDDHRQRPHPVIDIDIRPDHASVLERERVVDIHVASKLEFRIPCLHNGHLRRRHANHLLKPI